MQRLLDNLVFDFIDQNGYHLVISGEAGLIMEDLDKIQVNMLQSNTIPRLLPVEIEERDFNVKLYYPIGKRRLLSNLIKSKPMKPAEYFSLLLGIIAALEDSSTYMLNQGNYIIREHLIFVGRDYSDVFLTYLPLNGLDQKNPVFDDLRALFLKLAEKVETGGNYVPFLEQFFWSHRDSFSVGALRQFIVSLMNGNVGAPGVQQAAAVREYAPPAGQDIPPQPAAPPPQPGNVVPPPPPEQKPKKEKTKKEKVKKEKVKQDKPAAPAEAGQLSERARVIIACAGLMLAAVIWKTYLENPGEGMLYLSFGLTLLVLDAVYVLFKLWKPGAAAKENAAGSSGKAAAAPKAKASLQKKSSPPPEAAPLPAPVPAPPRGEEIDSSQYYEQLGQKTTLLQPSGETEVLDGHGFSVPEPVYKSYFEALQDGNMKRINIQGNSFIIGRNPDAVHYVEDGRGVSRVHLEVLKYENGWAVRDLQSKNYTFLNGEQLLANKVYPLKHGDRVKLATVEYTFRIGAV